jgi:hypothetical protein
MNNKPLLLALLALLALVKFIIAPVFEWQADLLNSSRDMQFKLDKSKSYIKSIEKIENRKVKLEQKLKTNLESIERYQVLSRYQLEKQKNLEQLFTEQSLKIKSIVWRDPIELDEGMQLSVIVQFSGKLKNYISTQMIVAGYGNSVEIANIGLTIRKQTQQSLGDITGNMVLLFKVIKEESQNE